MSIKKDIKSDYLNNFKSLFIILGLISTPIILYLKPDNLAQISIFDISYLIISQLIIFFITFILSLIFFKISFLRNIKFIEFFICNLCILFLLFFYKKVNLFFVFFEKFHYLFDNLLSLLLYLSLLIFFYYLVRVLKEKLQIFLILFILLNLSIFVINFLFYKYKALEIFVDNKNIQKIKDNNYKNTIKNIDHDEDLAEKINISLNNKDYEKKNNIFIIVPDAMISLELAEKENVVNSKNDYFSKLEKNNFNYQSNYLPTYPTTYLSIASILYGKYVATPNSKKYLNRNNFFPNNMLNINNDFFKIIKKLNANFFWAGNNWGPCKPNLSIKCINGKNTKISNFILKTQDLYHNSPFSYFYKYYADLFINVSAYDFMLDPNRYKKFIISNKKNNFYLIHLLKPHEPYNLDKNCKKIPEVKDKNKILEYYKNNYKCVFDTLMNWSKSYVNNEDNNMIIILGDHSINLNKNYKMKNKMNSTFFAYKGPEKCKNLELPRSHVNVMPFILNCMFDLQLDYEEDIQYMAYYEGAKKYGEVEFFKPD